MYCSHVLTVSKQYSMILTQTATACTTGFFTSIPRYFQHGNSMISTCTLEDITQSASAQKKIPPLELSLLNGLFKTSEVQFNFIQKPSCFVSYITLLLT